MWSIGTFGICIDIAINVIEEANMASLNDIKCSNLIFLDELSLKRIASKLKGHDCEKMVKRTGNEISLTLPTIDIGTTKINMELFSNKIVELVKASTTATALDTAQYGICNEKRRTDDPESKKDYGKIYLQIVLAFTQLESIFEAIKIDPSPETRNELSEWIKYSSSLIKHVIEAVRPGTSGKGPGDLEIDDIMKYQKITEDDMNEGIGKLESRASRESCLVPPLTRKILFN